jgi:hypothetical protein
MRERGQVAWRLRGWKQGNYYVNPTYIILIYNSY